MVCDTTIMGATGEMLHDLCFHIAESGCFRKHCARKVHRLRQVLKITHGKGKEFKKPASPSVESLQDGQ